MLEILMVFNSWMSYLKVKTPYSQEFQEKFYGDARKFFFRIISIDGQGFTQGPKVDVQKLLRGNIDIFKSDDEEVKIFGEITTWEIPEVLITKASLGSTLTFQGETLKIPPYPPQKIVDATGCGDAYIAGYLKKRLEGILPKEAAHFASQIGAKNMEVEGALF